MHLQYCPYITRLSVIKQLEGNQEGLFPKRWIFAFKSQEELISHSKQILKNLRGLTITEQRKWHILGHFHSSPSKNYKQEIVKQYLFLLSFVIGRLTVAKESLWVLSLGMYLDPGKGG